MIEIKPMDGSYIHNGCIHGGPVDTSLPPAKDSEQQDAVDLPPHPWSDETITELAKKYRGIWMGHGGAGEPATEFMREMTQRYGTCAILAWEGQKVVGHIRFYPMKTARLLAVNGTDVCPVLNCTAACEPEEDEGAIWVQCVMTCRPFGDSDKAEKVGARRGIGLKLAHSLVAWAREHGWQRIVKVAHSDLDVFYGILGGGGKAFWEKAGFKAVGTFYKGPPSHLSGSDYLASVQSQAAEKEMTEQETWTWHRMMYEL